MNVDQVYQKKWVACSDLNGTEMRLEISQVTLEDLGTGDQVEHKVAIWFRGAKKGCLLNVTNKNAIRKVYGGETDDWIGKQVVLYPAVTDFKGDTVECIRIKIPAGVVVAPNPPVAPALPPDTAQTQDLDQQVIDDEIPF